MQNAVDAAGAKMVEKIRHNCEKYLDHPHMVLVDNEKTAMMHSNLTPLPPAHQHIVNNREVIRHHKKPSITRLANLITN